MFETGLKRAMVASLLGATMMSAAGGAEPAFGPREAADGYATALNRMLDAAEAVHDATSAREATRTLADATRERVLQQSAVEAMPASERAVYARLLSERQAALSERRAQLDDAIARLMANPAYVQALANNAAAGPRVERR